MLLEFGRVVLVRFPFTNQSGAKQRPAVVISSPAYDRARPDVVIAAVTSQLRTAKGFGDVQLLDWSTAGLLKSSAVKPVIATLEKSLVVRSLGLLSARDQDALAAALSEWIGGPQP